MTSSIVVAEVLSLSLLPLTVLLLSLTIDDIVFVVDTGRVKEKNYDPHLKTSTLQVTWISQASAKQRKGRAGRVRSGVCFHLFSSRRYQDMRPFTESELLRTPLVSFLLIVVCCFKTTRRNNRAIRLSALGRSLSYVQAAAFGSRRTRG